jgi:predicted alpha/beta hydrolase
METLTESRFTAKSVTIPAADGFLLSGTLLEPHGEAKAVIQINSGTGIKKEFYLKLARFFAEQGFVAVVYDYRGIGASRPASLRGFEAYTRDWGERDMPGVLQWLHGEYPHLKKFIVAHSMGGQLIGLMPNHHLLSGVVSIASSIGYWGEFPAPFKYFTMFIWYAFIPLTTALLGYAPAKAIGQGEDLPRGVAREWADWCKHPQYLRHFFGKTIQQNFYGDVRVPWKAYCITDDPIATERTAQEILRYYSALSIPLEQLTPNDAAVSKIGHFGFFTEKIGKPLWKRPLDFFHTILQEKN